MTKKKMASKKPRKSKSLPTKSASKMASKNHTHCMLDHNHHSGCGHSAADHTHCMLDHDHHMGCGPMKGNKSSWKPSGKHEIFDKFLKSDFIDDVKKSLNSCVNSSNCSVSNSVEAANAAVNLTQEILSKISSTLSYTLEQNMNASSDLLKCKDGQDVVNFQHKIFETNFSNMVNLCLDVSFLMQSFASTHIELSSTFADKHIKCFTTRI